MADTRSRGNVSERSIDPRGKEVIEKILKKHSHELLLDSNVIAELKSAIPDNKLVDVVFDYYKKRLELIKNKVNKFKKALLAKYPNLSAVDLLRKAKKYSAKYDLSDGEFQMFINLLSTESRTGDAIYNIPNTPMGRTLGYSTAATMGDKLELKEQDLPHFQVIMTLEKETRQLHNRVIMQSLSYQGFDAPAISGDFDPSKHNPYNFIHPVIASLFLPKIPFIEERMLLASVANLIKTKQEGKPIMTQPEYELYWDLITDPNQRACSTDPSKTVEDLKNRVVLQSKLWDSVMKLRLGRYYADDMAGFLSAIESCTNGIFDAPDLVYTHDEGTILRRILNAFSLRTVYVSVSSMIDNAMQVTTLSISPAVYQQITSVPMINLRLPKLPQFQQINQNIHLTHSLRQPQWFMEGKRLVPKVQEIIHAHDVMFFYVDRRFKGSNLAFITAHKHFMLANMPKTLSGLDSVNDMVVNFDRVMQIGRDNYKLSSVVCVDVTNINPNQKNTTNADIVISGCRTLFEHDFNGNTTQFMYDPQNAGAPVSSTSNNRRGPMVALKTFNNAFDNIATRYGSIFTYVKIR